jgi:hypothetical protein
VHDIIHARNPPVTSIPPPPLPRPPPTQGRSWRQLVLAAAVAAAAALALCAAPAAAQNIPASMMPFGRIDCIKPGIGLDGFRLNPSTFQITQLPISATKSARRLLAGEEDVAVNGYDSGEDPKYLVAPYWRRPKKNGKRQPAPMKIARADAAEALAAATAIGAEVEAGVMTARAANISRMAARMTVAGASVTPQAVAVTPVTVTISNLFSITYYGTWKLVTNLVTSEVYVLYQCGTPKPTVPPGARAFEIPLRSVSVPDTTALAFMVRCLHVSAAEMLVVHHNPP